MSVRSRRLDKRQGAWVKAEDLPVFRAAKIQNSLRHLLPRLSDHSFQFVFARTCFWLGSCTDVTQLACVPYSNTGRPSEWRQLSPGVFHVSLSRVQIYVTSPIRSLTWHTKRDWMSVAEFMYCRWSPKTDAPCARAPTGVIINSLVSPVVSTKTNFLPVSLTKKAVLTHENKSTETDSSFAQCHTRVFPHTELVCSVESDYLRPRDHVFGRRPLRLERHPVHIHRRRDLRGQMHHHQRHKGTEIQ